MLSRVRFDLDTLKRLAQFAAKRSSEDRIPQVAGSLTFTTMLALVPPATVAVSLPSRISVNRTTVVWVIGFPAALVNLA